LIGLAVKNKESKELQKKISVERERDAIRAAPIKQQRKND